MTSPVIAIFDVGKTNKKLLVFDELYQLVYEKSITLAEINDEDGFPCEDLERLVAFVHDSLEEILSNKRYELKAVNFSAYGASFVFIGENGNPICPLYNYLKPYPEELLHQFYSQYGGMEAFSLLTASPVLGSLNSGMQLYRLKYERPDLFNKVKQALHLPQFLSFLLSHQPYAELTSIGCHTNLWNFKENTYHRWVSQERIEEKFPPIVATAHVTAVVRNGRTVKVGVGLHDSSAALIPYLKTISEPFVLISTGTWSISLNPYEHAELTSKELSCDSLCYLTYEGKPVKASRFFAGRVYEEWVTRIAAHFQKSPRYFDDLDFDFDLAAKAFRTRQGQQGKAFPDRDLSSFSNHHEAYHQLVCDLVVKQVESTTLVMNGSVRKIIVDGGFSRNKVFMNFLAWHVDVDVYAATMSQGTALGCAMAIHDHWNKRSIPQSLIVLKKYSKVEMPALR